jgi:hypothetical protein
MHCFGFESWGKGTVWKTYAQAAEQYNMVLLDKDAKHGLDWHESEYGQVANPCEHDHEYPGLEYAATGLLGCVKQLKLQAWRGGVFSFPSSGCQKNCR